MLPETRAHRTEDVICAAADLALETLPRETLRAPLPTMLSPGRTDHDSGTRVHVPRFSPVMLLLLVSE